MWKKALEDKEEQLCLLDNKYDPLDLVTARST